MTVPDSQFLHVTTPANVTHILAWWPAYLSGGDGDGWELLTGFDFAASCGGHWAPEVLDLPRDADPAGLAAFVAEVLGYPVRLEAYERKVSLFRRAEPIYYVSRAS